MQEIVSRSTIALVRKKSYKTYQLHAIAGKGNYQGKAKKVFKTVIAETFLWLRDRYRQFNEKPGEIPDEIKLPENPDEIKDEMLSSFSVNEGYIIDVVYIQEMGVWSFRLTEPDMGIPDNKRAAVPGRIFETDIAFRLIGDKVECGFQTICSQPENIEEDCEVFRPKLVKMIAEKVGLWSCADLGFEAEPVYNARELFNLKELIYDKNRQMPVLVAIDPEQTASNGQYQNDDGLAGDVKNISKTTPEELKVFHDRFREKYLTRRAPIVYKDPEHSESLAKLELEASRLHSIYTDPMKPPTPDMNHIAQSLIGFSHVYKIGSNMPGDYNQDIVKANNLNTQEYGSVQIYYPGLSSNGDKCETESFTATDIKWTSFTNQSGAHLRGTKAFTEYAIAKLRNFPKRNEQIKFGTVLFLLDARNKEKEIQLRKLRKSEDYIAQNETLNKKNENANQQIKELNSRLRDCDTERAALEKEIRQLQKEKDESEEQIKDEMNKRDIEIQQLKKKLFKNDRKFKALEMKLKRPKNHLDLIDWVNTCYERQLILHSRAEREIRRSREQIHTNLDLICDSIDLLATSYRNMRLGIIDEREFVQKCRDDCTRPVEVGLCGPNNIARYPDDYTVLYSENDADSGGSNHEIRRCLDLHLKDGARKDNLLRIYFFWDDCRRKVVIGSMPKHLDIISE